MPPRSLVVDAGCGDGLHLFPTARRFPALRFLGVDKNAGNIAFCKRYAEKVESAQLRFLREKLENPVLENKAALLLCIGTLQYIPDDVKVLKNFARALTPEGRLLLYVPVNGRMVLPLYRRFFKKMNHYEKRQHRQRVYSPQEVTGKLEMAGLVVLERQFTYGPAGILGHEIYSLLLLGMGNAGHWAWVFALLMVPALPFILLLNGVDYFTQKKCGNGLLVVAEKTTIRRKE